MKDVKLIDRKVLDFILPKINPGIILMFFLVFNHSQAYLQKPPLN